MKKKLLLILFLFLTTIVYGANEIKSYYESGNTLYAIIRDGTGQAWDTGDAAFEAWNAADDYNIPLVDKSGGFYIGDFNTAVTAGYYSIITHQQEGGTAADTDPPIWKDYGYWDGTMWTSGASISDINSVESKIDDVLEDTGTTIPAQIVDLKTAMDANFAGLNNISIVDVNTAMTNRLNLYDPPTKAEMDAGFADMNDITVTEIWDAICESTYSYKDYMRLMASVMFGKASGGNTTNIKFRDIADTKNRIDETVDTYGNRTSVTLDPD